MPRRASNAQEQQSEAHKIFRSVPGHQSKHEHTDVRYEDTLPPGIDNPGSTGVIYVTDRAVANGFVPDSDEWANFGQGAPETGPIPGAPERPTAIDLAALGHGVNEYAPTAGAREIRDAIANLYNVQYRQGKASQYTWENVAIVPGGRAGLTRIASVIGQCYVSYQVGMGALAYSTIADESCSPEYTAYDQMLSSFRKLAPIPSTLHADDNFKLSVPRLRDSIKEQGLSVIVASNPRNPTGQVVAGDDLADLVRIGREGVTVILDEFYSSYIYEGPKGWKEGDSISAASYIEDVDDDATVIIDGLTKGFRMPGWRCSWVLGPKSLIRALAQAGSYLDGGASHVMQMAALPMLDPHFVKLDRLALQKHFRHKRDVCLKRLRGMGFTVTVEPKATFYVWLDLQGLPPPLDAGLSFFEEALKERVIVVPAHHYVRLSFGPKLEELERGLDGIERLLIKTYHRLKGMPEEPSASEDSK